MASVEEKLLEQYMLMKARENPVKVEPSVVVAEKKEELLGAKAEQIEVSVGEVEGEKEKKDNKKRTGK